MTTLIRVELRKLRTMRVTYGLLVAATGVTALFTYLQASNSGGRAPSIATAAGLRDVTTASGMALIFAAILGIVVTTGEFRHSTATLTYLATPDRRRILVAKTAAAALAGVAYGLAGGLAATTVGLSYAAGQGDHANIATAAVVGHVAGAAAGAALLAALSAVVGSLIRSQLAGVVGTLVWCLVLESILGGDITAVRPYLPYTAASTLGGTKLGAAAFGPGFSVSAHSALPFAAAAALLAATVAVGATVSSRTTVERDVT